MNQADKFSEARRKLGLTQGYVAEKTGLEQWQVSNVENGKKKIPYKELIDFYVENGISKEWLLEKEEPTQEWEKRAAKAESKVEQLERKIMEMQSEITTLYKFLFKNRDKLDLTDLEASLGKRKASSFPKATLSEKELMYKLNFTSQR